MIFMARMLGFALFLLVCAVHASEDGTSDDGQKLPCPVISKNGEECFVFNGHCQVSSDVMRRCLNPLGSSYSSSSSADASDPQRTKRGVSGEHSFSNKRGVQCDVYKHKGQLCYYRPMGGSCRAPAGVTSRCVQGYGKRGLPGQQRLRATEGQLIDNGGLVPNDIEQRNVGEAERQTTDMKRESETRKINLRRLLSVPRRDQADDDEAALLERQKRVVYYYDDYTAYEEAAHECRTYKLEGHVCYWRPVGNDCKQPPLVNARCLNLPDFGSY